MFTTTLTTTQVQKTTVKLFDIRQNSTIIFRCGLDLPRVIGIIEYRGNVNFNLLSFPTYFHALSLNGQKNGRGLFPLPFFSVI